MNIIRREIRRNIEIRRFCYKVLEIREYVTKTYGILCNSLFTIPLTVSNIKAHQNSWIAPTGYCKSKVANTVGWWRTWNRIPWHNLNSATCIVVILWINYTTVTKEVSYKPSKKFCINGLLANIVAVTLLFSIYISSGRAYVNKLFIDWKKNLRLNQCSSK